MSPTQNSSPTFTFVTGGAPTVIECRVDDDPYAPCTSPFESTPVNDGDHQFDVRVRDDAGNEGSDSFDFTVDGAPPTARITAGPDGPTNDSTPTFEFTTTGDPQTVECRVDAGALTPCADSFTTPNLAEGAHTFTVIATDEAGNEGSDQRSFVVDTTAPIVQITSGPTGTIQNDQPSFGFTVSGNPSVVECRIDGGAFAACTSPFAAGPLSDGPHTFLVRATDAAGNAASDSRDFTVDTTAPTVTITNGPNGLTNDDTPTFAFTVSGGATEIECRFGTSGAFGACTSPVTAPALPDGDNVFTVRARDAVGNQASDSRSFTVDTTPPTVQVTSGPTGATNDSTPTFTFTTGNGATRTECRVGGGSFASCTSPFTSSALTDGSYTFTVRAFDAANNTASDSQDFTIDTVGPQVTITSGPEGFYDDNAGTFTFSVSADATVIECQLGGGFAPCQSPYDFTRADGAYTFTVRARDAAGNQTSDSQSFTIDTVPPTVQITSGPTGVTNDSTPTFNFTTGNGATRTECRVGNGSFSNCTSPFTTPALGDGAYTFTVRAFDAAGNSASDSQGFEVDTQGPQVTITSGPSGLYSDDAGTFTFSVSADATVIECRLGAGFAPCQSPFGFSRGDGTYTFTVRARDAAGNQSSDSQSFTIDTTPPSINILSGPSGLTTDSTPTFTFEAGNGATRTECRVGTGAFSACNSPYTTGTLGDGSYTFTVRAFDAAGNSASASRSFQVDTRGPQVTITSGPEGFYSDDAGTFTFTVSSDAVAVECQLEGGFEPCQSPYNFSLGDGSYTFVVRARDAAGNQSSDSQSFTIDSRPPSVQITSGPTGVTGDSTPTFRFTVSGGATTVQCRVGSRAYVNCASSYTSPPLANGTYTFTVRAFDAAGNVGSASRTFTVRYVARPHRERCRGPRTTAGGAGRVGRRALRGYGD